jgi:hypothetical protein
MTAPKELDQEGGGLGPRLGLSDYAEEGLEKT